MKKILTHIPDAIPLPYTELMLLLPFLALMTLAH